MEIENILEIIYSDWTKKKKNLRRLREVNDLAKQELIYGLLSWSRIRLPMQGTRVQSLVHTTQSS